MLKKTFLLLFLALITSFVNAQKDEPGEINSILTDWVESFNSGNYQKSVSIYSPDFIGYYPNESDLNFKNIEEQYKHIFNNKNLSVKLEVDIREINVSGNLGFVQLILKAIIKPKFSTEPGVALDKGIQVWKKSEGGWKLFRSSTFPMQESK